MERRLKKVVLNKDNSIELPEEALKALQVQKGDELIIIYTKEMAVLMSPEKFGELILEKK